MQCLRCAWAAGCIGGLSANGGLGAADLYSGIDDWLDGGAVDFAASAGFPSASSLPLPTLPLDAIDETARMDSIAFPSPPGGEGRAGGSTPFPSLQRQYQQSLEAAQ